MEEFIAANRREGTVILGPWENVCDLDKRSWNVRLFNKNKVDTPLAMIQKTVDVPSDSDGSGIGTVIRWVELWSHKELEGMYI